MTTVKCCCCSCRLLLLLPPIVPPDESPIFTGSRRACCCAVVCCCCAPQPPAYFCSAALDDGALFRPRLHLCGLCVRQGVVVLLELMLKFSCHIGLLKASKSSKVFKPNRSESLQTVNFPRDQGPLAPLASVVRLMPSKEDNSLQQCVTVGERMF